MAGLVSGAAAAGLVAGGIVLLPGSPEVDVRTRPQPVGDSSGTAWGRLPRTGVPVEVRTADGSTYRVAAVTASVHGAAPRRSPSPARSSFPYIEYVLTNPSRERVLLEHPGDVFLPRDLVAPRARGRCVWQPGVPKDMCTPPVRSEVVRSLRGGALEPGDGGDKYLPPGASYLVRATVEVPVNSRIRPAHLRLYIWKQLYMADRPAKEAPFPE